MNEAIEKSNAGATTVTKQSEKFPYEIPSIIICPEPGYKQTLLKLKHLIDLINNELRI